MKDATEVQSFPVVATANMLLLQGQRYMFIRLSQRNVQAQDAGHWASMGFGPHSPCNLISVFFDARYPSFAF